jgi:phosphate transport system substrate-binding protein
VSSFVWFQSPPGWTAISTKTHCVDLDCSISTETHTTTTTTVTETLPSPTTSTTEISGTPHTTETRTSTSTTTVVTETHPSTSTHTTTTTAPLTTTETHTITTSTHVTTVVTETLPSTTTYATISTAPLTTTDTNIIITDTPVTTAVTTAVSGTVTTTVTVTATKTVSSFGPPPSLQSGGSTFVNPVMQSWIVGFAKYTNQEVLIGYQQLDSPAGVEGIMKKTFEFTDSDAPVNSSQYSNYTTAYGPLLQIPGTLGAVAILYNIPGVTVNLNLTGPILAKIYLGEITMWNDPAIAALNPGCHEGSATCVLPNNAIQPVHRADGSGTTYALTNYFEKVSKDWNASFTGGCPCYGFSITWPPSEIGANGSSAIAAYVKNNPYTIGYAATSYAPPDGLKVAAIQNSAGKFFIPSLASLEAAAADFSAQVQANPTFTITDAPGAGSYPIATFTYILIWQDQTNQQVGSATARFLQWVVNQGQTLSPPLNYSMLPADVISIDQSLIRKLNYNGVQFINTSTTVSCSSASVFVHSAVTCKATVVGTGSVPTGTVTWSSSGSGTFSKLTCRLSKGACSVKFTPTTAGSMLLTAVYGGDSRNSPSTGSYLLTVLMKATMTTVSCAPRSVVPGSSTITCRAKVKGYSPTGTVSWSQSGTGSVSLNPAACTLSNGACSLTMHGITTGKVTLQATYSGDLNNQPRSGSANLTIKT